jgi:hypothetical protein
MRAFRPNPNDLAATVKGSRSAGAVPARPEDGLS